MIYSSRVGTIALSRKRFFAGCYRTFVSIAHIVFDASDLMEGGDLCKELDANGRMSEERAATMVSYDGLRLHKKNSAQR